MKSLRESHTEATIEALLSAGRRQFGSRGYDAVSLDDIAAEARVTTGAIYHHFMGSPRFCPTNYCYYRNPRCPARNYQRPNPVILAARHPGLAPALGHRRGRHQSCVHFQRRPSSRR